MKKIISAILVTAMLLTFLPAFTVISFAETVTVVADKGWKNATYDAATGVLTNVDGGYSFKVDGSKISYNGSKAVNAEEVVIPASYNGTAITTVDSFILTGTDGATTDTKKIIVSEGITTLGDRCFEDLTNVESIVLPSTLTALGKRSCQQMSALTSIIIPSGVTTIPEYCFDTCTSIKSATFMGEVTAFDTYACIRWYGCKEIIFKGKTAPATFARTPFFRTPNEAGCIIYYPSNGKGYTDELFTSQFTASFVTYQTITAAPDAEVEINGIAVAGKTVTGIYSKFISADNTPEGGSSYVWESADDSAFTKNVTTLESGSIKSGDSKDYTLTENEAGKYIRFGVTPKSTAAEDNVGKTVYAALPDAVRKPVTKPVVALTSPYNGYKCHQNVTVVLSATATCDNTQIAKIEYYANDSIVATATTTPFESSWTPTEPGTYEIYAVAYNSLNETGRSGSVSIKVYSLEESIESVAAEKWCYDFNSFTSTDTYTSTTGLVLPGEFAPTVTVGAGVTMTSASGVYGKPADDYSLQINSIEGSASGATIVYDKSLLDNPVNNVMLETEIAVSSADETRDLLYYATSTGKYITFRLNSNGTIGYYADYDTRTFKYVTDENDVNVIMQPEVWYTFGLLLDFENVTLTFYMNGEEIEMVDCGNPYGFTDLSYAQLQTSHKATGNTSVTYIDNMKIYQVQDSYVTSVISSLTDKNFVLTGSDVTFGGYAKDSRPGKTVDYIEIYANDTLVKTVNGDSYSFIKNDLSPGVYNVTAKAVSSDGLVGYSSTFKLTVSAVTYPTMFSDDMLLQRNKEIRLFGYGVNGAEVTATICGKSASAKVSNGTWNIVLPPMPATKSTTLSITTSDGVVTVFNNVAVGELILFSGQSNVQYSLDKFRSLKDQADKDYPDIRLYKQSVTGAGSPQTDNATGYWQTATIFNSYSFSGIAFLTAKDYYLSQNCDVPVGLIYAAYGGSSINMWNVNGSFTNHPDTVSLASGSTYYNKTIAPWTNFTIGHIVWYQGEANTQLTTPYEHMLTSLIDGWREAFNDDVNVIVVMLPIYDYPNKYGSVRSAVGVREAQWNVSERMKNVETVVAIDTGETNNIHPSDKLPLANRASRILQHFTTDNANLVWKSPSYEKHEYDAENNKLTVYLKDVAGGLKTSDGTAARGFMIAGDNGVFTDVAVTLDGNKIIVDTSSVTGTPKLRYAWQSTFADADGKSIINLVNSEGLPVAPFRTDRDVYRFNTKNADGTYSGEVNFTPITRDLTVSDILNGEATIKVQAYDCDDTVTKVEIYCDGTLLGEAALTEDNCYYTYKWTKAVEGSHSFYAVATDEHNVTSISNGVKTVTPKTYVYNVGYDNDPDIIFSGSFEEGITATAVNADGYMLVLAAYVEDANLLTCVKIVKANEKATISKNELVNSTVVKAFILKDLSTLHPVGIPTYFE